MADNSQRGQKSVGPLPLKMLGRRVRAPDVDGAAQAEAHRHQGPRGQGRHDSMVQLHFLVECFSVLFVFVLCFTESSANFEVWLFYAIQNIFFRFFLVSINHDLITEGRSMTLL